MQSILGIDVSKKTLDVVLLKDLSRQHKIFNNDTIGYQQLQRWLLSCQAECVHACLEATGQYGDGVAEYLYGENHQVSVVNPARIKRYGESKLHRNKTDKADAFLIAEFCLKEQPSLWHPLSAEIKHLRALVRHLHDLQTNLNQETNRLSAGEQDPWVLDDLHFHIDYLHARIKATLKAMQEFINQTPKLKVQQDLLISIPGIAELTAAKLLAEIGDISVFENAPQLAAYAGLNPRGFRSGSSVYKKSIISKQGRPILRQILYMPAVSAKRHNPVIRTFCARLKERDLPNMAIISAAMRKLLHQVYGVLKNQIPFDPSYGDQFNFGA